MSTYKITKLGHLGDGIAHGPIYAPLTLPGDHVTGDLDGDTLKNVKIKTPSDLRVTPLCPHFKSCGGCQLMHAHDNFIEKWKTNVVTQALSAHGISCDMRVCHTSPPHSRRRATFAAKRTKKSVLVGFHARASDVVIDIPNCVLLSPDVLASRSIILDLAMLGASRKSIMNAHVTQTQTGLDIAITNAKQLDGQLRMTLGHKCEVHSLARLSWNDEIIAQRIPPLQRFGTTDVSPPSGAFLQATKEGETTLVNTVQDIVKDAKSICDLFSGCGTFTLPLAKSAQILAVEGQEAMCKALDHGWRMSEGLKKVTTQTRDLFRRPLLADELNAFEAIVIDPPRAGAHAQIHELCQSSVPVIAYVSCNPVTFAKDAAQLLKAGYQLDFVQTIDQFRWSTHVELVGAFSKL